MSTHCSHTSFPSFCLESINGKENVKEPGLYHPIRVFLTTYIATIKYDTLDQGKTVFFNKDSIGFHRYMKLHEDYVFVK